MAAFELRSIGSLALLAVLGCAHRVDASELGQAAMVRGDYPEAARQLAVAVDEHPDDARLWRELARARMRDGKLPEARIAIARADDLHPGDPATVLLRGQIRMGQHDRAGALADAQIVAKKATVPRQLQELAVLFARLGRADEALAAARAAVTRSGGEAAAYTNLAVLAFELRRLDAAAKALSEGRGRHPEDVGLAEAEAAFLVATGQTERAREAYRDLLKRHENPALVHQALALLAHDAGDLEDARAHAEQAMELAGRQRADVNYTYVVILRDLGETDAARQALRRALRRFPGDPDLRALDSTLHSNG